MKRAAILALFALVGCTDREAANPARPEAYALRLPVTAAPGAPLQRLSVPAEALATLRSPDRSDLRVFDASGTALPMAMTVPPGGKAELHGVRLEALPILGTGGALEAGGSVLSIEESDGGRVVRVTRATGEDDGAALLGVLLDTRAIADPVRSLRLDARWPAQQPVNFTVEASANLSDWTPLGSRTLYRKRADASGAIGDEAIALGRADLKGRYVRIGWSSPSKLLGPVEVRGATLGVARRIGGDRPTVAIDPPTRVSAHELRFTAGHAIAPVAIRIGPAAGEMLVPVAIFGRNGPEQGWTRLGGGVVRGGSEPITLQGRAFSDYRIEADARTPGFAAPPAITLAFEPAQLVVLFNGKPPYALAAGAADASNRYLGLGALIPDYRAGAEDRLALAKVAANPTPRLALADADDRLLSPRKAVLWGLLIFGVAALGLMVWRLWRPGYTQA